MTHDRKRMKLECSLIKLSLNAYRFVNEIVNSVNLIENLFFRKVFISTCSMYQSV